MYQNTNSQSDLFNKWYARSVADITLDTDALAEHMSNHNSPYSVGMISGVLKDMIKCIKELVLDGKRVKLNDLAIFYLGIHCNSADSLEAFDINKNVTDIRLQACATGTLSTKNLKSVVKLKEAGEYSLPSDEVPTEPTV